jgi:hypothetical protein
MNVQAQIVRYSMQTASKQECQTVYYRLVHVNAFRQPAWRMRRATPEHLPLYALLTILCWRYGLFGADHRVPADTCDSLSHTPGKRGQALKFVDLITELILDKSPPKPCHVIWGTRRKPEDDCNIVCVEFWETICADPW